MMTPEILRFRDLEAYVAAEKGGFTLFALFMREELPDRWDLIVSAPWIGGDKQAAVGYFVEVIKSRLGVDDLIRLNRIIIAAPDEAGIQALNEAVQVEHGGIEVRDHDFFGVTVKLAYIITSKRVPAPASA